MALGLASQGCKREEACTGIQERADGLWSAEVRETVRRAYVATGNPRAEATFSRVDGPLTGYARTWAEARTAACSAREATWARHRPERAARLACLDGLHDEARALVAAVSAPATSPDDAVVAVLRLAPVTRCADAEALLARPPPPADASVRAQIQAVRALMHAAQAHLFLVHTTEAAVRYTTALQEARKTGHAQTLAEVLFALAQLHTGHDERGKAEALLRESAALAARAGDHGLEARGWGALHEMLRWQVGRSAEATSAARSAREAAERSRDAFIRAAVHLSTASASQDVRTPEADTAASKLLERQEAQTRLAGLLAPRIRDSAPGRDAVESDRRCRQALEKRKELFGAEHPLVGDALWCFARLAMYPTLHRQAVPSLRRALTLEEGAFQPDRGLLLDMRVALAVALTRSEVDGDERRRNHEEAGPLFAQAIATLANAPEPDKTDLVNILAASAEHLEQGGEYMRAAEQLLRCVDLLRRRHGTTSPHLAPALLLLGTTLYRGRRYDDALRVFQEAQALAPHVEPSLPFPGLEEATRAGRWYLLRRLAERGREAGPWAHAHLALTLDALGRRKEALRHSGRAYALAQNEGGAVNWLTPEIRYSLGASLQELGRTQEALPVLEEAWAGQVLVPGRISREQGVLASRLGRALWELDKDRPRAWKLVAEAGAALKQGPLDHFDQERELQRVRRFLARHAAPPEP